MATAPMDTVMRHLRRAVLRQHGTGRTDGQLLASFIDQKDEAAFEALVRRHGPLVFGICRRVVGNHHDAEDAFQATFLVLARKASSVKPRERVANWLHGVALRTAMKAKAMTAKRRGREKQVTEMPEPEAAPQDPWRDLRSLLDQELNGLPANYRLPILLCDLEGKTIKEATRQLGWLQGTLAGRLARGRKLLAKRLASRGVVLSAGALAAVLSQQVTSAGVPTALMSSTIKTGALIATGQATVAGMVPAKVAILTEGVLQAMLLSKIKIAMGGLLLVALLIGAARAIYQTQAGEPQKKGPAPETKDKHDVAAPKTMEERAIQGTWTLVSAEFDDETKVNFGKGSVELVVTNNLWIWKEGGTDKVETYRIDPTQSPKQIDITWQENKEVELPTGEKRQVSIPHVRSGIYEINGDTLKLCESDMKRPTTFSTKGRSFIRLQIYKRSGAPVKAAEGEKNEQERDAAKTDLDRLQGVWSVVSVGGKPLKSEKAVFMVDGKRACWQTSDSEMQGGLYLDPTSKPKTYDLAMSTKTIEGIYSLEGDTLRLCYDLGNEPKRPGSFITEKGSQQILIVLKRTHGPEVFPCRLADGTRAFPTVIERTTTTPPQLARLPTDPKPTPYPYKEAEPPASGAVQPKKTQERPAYKGDNGGTKRDAERPVTKVELATVVPHFFTVAYPQKNLWLRVDDRHWVERYPDGTESKYKILGRTKARAWPGTLIAKIAGDPKKTGNDNDGSYQVFIPDKGKPEVDILFRHLGRGDSDWYSLSVMRSVE